MLLNGFVFYFIRLRWLGHLLRSPPNHPALAIYTFNPRAAGWSRPHGDPRTRWSDVLRKDLKQLGTTLMEASNIALDRSRWRSTIVARAVSTPSWQEPYSPVNLWFDLDKIAIETLFVGNDSRAHPEQHIENIQQSK